MLTSKLFRKPRNALEGGSQGEAPVPNVPARLMETCPACRAMIFTDQLEANACVCPNCGAHRRMDPRRRVALIADPGSFRETDASLASANPLDFPGYDEKLEKARAASGEPEGVVTGFCAIDGQPCGLFVMNPDFMMGSMGTAVGEKITRLFEAATAQKLPVVGFTVSGGARMQEGILSLM